MSHRFICRCTGPKSRVVIDIDSGAPSIQAPLGHIKPQLTSAVVFAKVPGELDVLEAVNAIVEESRDADGARNGAENFGHV